MALCVGSCLIDEFGFGNQVRDSSSGEEGDHVQKIEFGVKVLGARTFRNVHSSGATGRMRSVGFCVSCCDTCAALSSFCSITPPRTRERRSNNYCANIAACASRTFLLMLRSSTPMKVSGPWPNENWQTVAPTTWMDRKSVV